MGTPSFVVVNGTTTRADFAVTLVAGATAPADLALALARLNGRSGQVCTVTLTPGNAANDASASYVVNNEAPPTVTLQRGDGRTDTNVTIADALFIAQ